MYQYQETCKLPYSVDQLYDLISDIESYPAFIPWCDAVRIIEKKENMLLVDLAVCYKGFSESYRSEVILSDISDSRMISAKAVSGPFKMMDTEWMVTNLGNETEVKFFIAFSFNSVLIGRMIGLVFEKSCKDILQSFKARAEHLYGKR